jgi:hypothetical protein
MKLGKKPFVASAKDFQLATVEVAMPAMPKTPFGYGTIFSDWGMLGNDNVGDCAVAGPDHEVMLWNKLAKHPVEFTTANTLSDYSAITGYDPNDPNTDQGAYVRDVYNYRRTTGLIDKVGKRHKIEAFVQIDAKDWEMMITCVWTFGCVGMGFEVPDSIWDQIGGIWTVVPGSQNIGGHYVPVVGTQEPQKECSVVTWGKKQRMSREFYEAYNDEAWVPLTKESLLPAANVRHIDWTTLSLQLASL